MKKTAIRQAILCITLICLLAANLTSFAAGYGTKPKILKPGDKVKTTNGTYTIKAGQWERQKELKGSAFKPLAPDTKLPAWKSAWNSYPRVTMPKPKPVRSKGKIGNATYDRMMMFNAYETERIIRTIYKAAKDNPKLWKGKDPSKNEPDFTIKVVLTDGMAYGAFYPWKTSEVTKKVSSAGGGKVFKVYAYDSYNKGKYLDTHYFIQ